MEQERASYQFDLIEKYCNESPDDYGLWISDGPTGFGKTHNVLKYLYSQITEHPEDTRKYFFITPLKKNLPVEKFKQIFIEHGQKDLYDRKVLVVTSVSKNEGKSTVAANLAIGLAEQGKKVILVDGDIRRPSQFLIFNLKVEEKNELGEFLKGAGVLGDILMKGDRQHLYFLGGRNCYSSSTEMLHSDKLPRLMNACKKNADYVIIDTPPAGLLGDAQVFAQCADAVLMVVRQNYMLAEDINDILDDFRDNHSKILGVVLNGVQTFSHIADSTVGGYYGRYGHYGKYGKSKGR